MANEYYNDGNANILFSGQNGGNRYANPFFGLPYKYLPQNVDQMMWWANHFLLRFGFYRAVLSRISNYFITELKIECDDSESKERYKEAFKELKWKQRLAEAGINLIAYGNVYMTVSQGFTRFIECPKCHKISSLEKLNDYKFSEKGIFSAVCPSCTYAGAHESFDKTSRDVKDINIAIWHPREIQVVHEETRGEYEYYWRIPEEYKRRVLSPDNKFFSKRTPKIIYDAILAKRDLAFNPNNFMHIKFPTPAGIKADGRGIPPCIYLFDDFFMLKVLQRYNEAICLEDIVPFRVISMTDQLNPQANPILGQGAPQWRSAVEQMVTEHRKDPASYHVFPFPLNFQHLGGDAKNLVPTELMQQAIANILNALYVPQELYTMNLQTQAIGPALRLFENSWSLLVDTYNQLLSHWADVIGKIKGLPKADVALIPTTLSDDMEKKSVLGQLVASNSIARSELLGIYNMDFKEQLRKKYEEERITKELQEEEQVKEQLRQSGQAGMGLDSASQANSGTPMDVLSQAQELAQQLFPLDGAERRSKLQEIKAQDQTLWSAVKGALDELTSGAKSQGVSAAKQNASGQQQ